MSAIGTSTAPPAPPPSTLVSQGPRVTRTALIALVACVAVVALVIGLDAGWRSLRDSDAYAQAIGDPHLQLADGVALDQVPRADTVSWTSTPVPVTPAVLAAAFGGSWQAEHTRPASPGPVDSLTATSFIGSRGLLFVWRSGSPDIAGSVRLVNGRISAPDRRAFAVQALVGLGALSRDQAERLIFHEQAASPDGEQGSLLTVDLPADARDRSWTARPDSVRGYLAELAAGPSLAAFHFAGDHLTAARAPTARMRSQPVATISAAQAWDDLRSHAANSTSVGSDELSIWDHLRGMASTDRARGDVNSVGLAQVPDPRGRAQSVPAWEFSAGGEPVGEVIAVPGVSRTADDW